MTKITLGELQNWELTLMNQWSTERKVLYGKDTTCLHCGDTCTDGVTIWEDNPFCCVGCKMVYSILQENGLQQYYALNQDAGISQKGKTNIEFAYLEDPVVISRLINFQDETKTKITFYLPQIHCSSCLWLLENLPLLNDGISWSRVDFLKKQVSITFRQSEISLRKLVELMASIGYAPHIQLADLEANAPPSVDKALYYKLGLAGFVFGNIMLISFPEYLGLSDQPDEHFNSFFSYLGFVLILPVLFYSGADYLRSAWQGLQQRHLNIDVPISLGIAALFLRSVYEIFYLSQPGYLDSLAGLIFFLLIGKWFQQTTYSRISFDRDFKSYFPIACTLKENQQERQVSLDKLKVMDIVLIRHGELIPADGYLLKGTAEIDYSFVTGESDPVAKSLGDYLYAGGKQMGGRIEIQVAKKVSNSYLTQLWNDHAFDKTEDQGSTSVLADKVASLFTWAILLIAFATLIYWLPRDVNVAINAFTSVLIIACPCAVALSIPFTFGNVTRLFARQGIYFKNIQVIESLAIIDHIVFDKTGTLTNAAAADLTYHGKPLSKLQKGLVQVLSKQSAHPLSQQVANFIEKNNKESAQEEAVDLLELTDLSVITGQGISATIAGHEIRLGARHFINPSAAVFPEISAGVFIAIDAEFMGVYTRKNNYRKGMTNVIREFDKWAKLSLLSGDNDQERKKLAPLFRRKNAMHFSQRPTEKLEFIKGLQEQSEMVAMIGDGLNDAGALQQSNVGIVITENTSNFTPACDIIMSARQFEKLPLLFSFSRLSIRLIYTAYTIALLYNSIGLSYAVQGNLSPVIAAILMPLSSVSIVLFGVGASTFLAWRKSLILGDENHFPN